ncbi:MAG TPA: 2,3-diaminopropionate biosynthesis protein SbnA [Solirubrobacteraceae bacterium]
MPVRPAVDGILAAIGDTPLVALRRYLGTPDISVWAKLEAANPGGSAKDRPAARMLGDALEAGLVAPGATVIESTSGNMGVGLAQACRYHGLGLICVLDVRAHDTNVRTLRALGADVRIVSRPDPETGDLLAARLRLVAHLLETIPGAYWPNQYANASNPAAHAAGTMREIDEALDGDLDYVFVATSTTGTLRGCQDYLRAHGRATQIVAVDAAGSALFGGTRGARALPGFGAGIETELSRSARFDALMRVSDLDCVTGCRRLVEREAIFAGGSSGGVAFALETLAPQMAAGSRCALILPDGGRGYLRTVYDDDWVRETLGCPADELAAMVRAVAAEPAAA